MIFLLATTMILIYEYNEKKPENFTYKIKNLIDAVKFL